MDEADRSKPFLWLSPRWLVTKQRVEEARTILRRLHVLAGQDYDSQFADQELESIVKQEEVDKDLAVGWLDLLRVPSYRKRSILAFVTMLAYAGTGTLTITNYLPSITGRLGYDSVQQLCLAGGYITCMQHRKQDMPCCNG